MNSELRLRIISGVIMAAIFITGIILGGWVFATMIGIVSLVIWHEWFEMNLPNGDDRARLIGFCALLAAFVVIVLFNGITLLFALVGIFAAACGFLLSWPGAKDGVAGLVYAGGFLVAMVTLRGDMSFTPGLVAILYLCAVVWLTDIGAYFAGRFFGGPKLAPAISPNKTLSGAAGGILASIVGAALVAWLANLDGFAALIALAIMLSVISQSGDLFESWLKRSSGVKDSGTFIPGHGGAMDRVDGLLFAAIFLWLVSSLRANWADPALAYFG